MVGGQSTGYGFCTVFSCFEHLQFKPIITTASDSNNIFLIIFTNVLFISCYAIVIHLVFYWRDRVVNPTRFVTKARGEVLFSYDFIDPFRICLYIKPQHST